MLIVWPSTMSDHESRLSVLLSRLFVRLSWSPVMMAALYVWWFRLFVSLSILPLRPLSLSIELFWLSILVPYSLLCVQTTVLIWVSVYKYLVHLFICAAFYVPVWIVCMSFRSWTNFQEGPKNFLKFLWKWPWKFRKVSIKIFFF